MSQGTEIPRGYTPPSLVAQEKRFMATSDSLSLPKQVYVV